MAVIKPTIAASLLIGCLMGCEGRTSFFPNSDPALRKVPAEFAADAAKRFPYKLQAPRGGEAVARAQVGYSLNALELVNRSDETWTDCEVWVNGEYVCFIPTVEPGILKTMPFQTLYNDNGKHFPIDNSKPEGLIHKVELYRDGKMYDVTCKLAD